MRSVFAAFGSAWLWVSTVTLLLTLTLRGTIGLPDLGVTHRFISAVPVLHGLLASRPVASVFASLVFAPLFEEALFRMLPLSIALVLGGLLHDKFAHHSRNLIRAVLIVVCCLLFGLAHGSVLNIAIQGVVGLVLGRLYLRHSDNQLKAYVACVMVHAMYNFAVLCAANIG
jgi:membrane protease YdiL (CAAX protease family)